MVKRKTKLSKLIKKEEGKVPQKPIKINSETIKVEEDYLNGIRLGSSIIRHELGNFAFFKSHFALCDFQPYTNPSKTKHQARKPTSQSDPNNGQNRKPLGFQRRQRVPIKLLIPQKRRRIESRQAPAAISQRRRNRTRELVVADVKRREPNEQTQLLGNRAREQVLVEVDHVEIGAQCELRRNRAL